MICIEIPLTYEPERRYVLSVVFQDFWGLDIQIEKRDRTTTQITLPGSDRTLILADGLFATPPQHWLQPASLPPQPLAQWTLPHLLDPGILPHPQIPVLYGQDPQESHFFQKTDTQIALGLDIFGSIFFLLSRYEEAIKRDRDLHDRFPASAALAFQENFLHRPLVNEYLEILWACLQHLWPGLHRTPRQFRTLPSHDVDLPYLHAFAPPAQLARGLTGDLLKRRRPQQAIARLQQWQQARQGNLATDPYNTFDWLMGQSETHGLTSTFYFITAHTDPTYDPRYPIDHPLLRQLLQNIHQRGHEIGLHGSYHTYRDTTQTRQELARLQQVCAAENIQQPQWGGRQHYLRWRTPDTCQTLADAGLAHDSTLTFAEVAGFRCGTCYEYPLYHLASRQPLPLREKPLIVMECTVLDAHYMGLGENRAQAFAVMHPLKETCRRYQGDFTLLWHNSRFPSPADRELYQQILAA